MPQRNVGKSRDRLVPKWNISQVLVSKRKKLLKWLYYYSFIHIFLNAKAQTNVSANLKNKK